VSSAPVMLRCDGDVRVAVLLCDLTNLSAGPEKLRNGCLAQGG
jgi:hypothetical protein